jgi:hypothetical protein
VSKVGLKMSLVVERLFLVGLNECLLGVKERLFLDELRHLRRSQSLLRPKVTLPGD